MSHNVFLLEIEKTDLGAHQRIRNIPEVKRYLRQVGECTEEKQALWYSNLIGDTTRHVFSIKADGVVVGSCCLLSIDHYKGHAEVGWFVDPDFQSMGYAKTAVDAMLDFAFSTINLHSVYAFVYSDNKKGMSFVERMGFNKVGVLRERRNRGTHYVDEVIYDLLSREFYSDIRVQ